MLSWNDILILLPELYLVAAVCVLLLMDAFIKPEQRNATHWLAIVITAITAFLVVMGQPPAGATAFGGMFIRDTASEILSLFTLITVILVFVFSRPYLKDRKLWHGEFYVLTLFAALGVMLLVSAGNLIMVYLGLELLTLSSYALVAFNRDSRMSSEAAIKYFVLGALASGTLLYGMSMVYGATGTLDLAHLHAIAAHVAMPNLLRFGLIFMIVGIAFKLGAAPFHMWLPDVYQGAPTASVTFVASASKLAAFGMAYRLLSAFGPGDVMHQWQLMLAILAVLSLVIGNLVAIVQSNLKRMLAYSTIAHMGYLLLGLVNATPSGYAAAMFYAISYALMSTVAFGVILAMSRAGFECEEIDDFKGLNERSRWMAFLMMLAMFSLAGVPPLFGFFAKLMILKAAIDAGMMWLAIVAILAAIVGLYYYLRVVKVMYFDKPDEDVDFRPQTDMPLRWVLSINALALLGLGLYWGPLLSWCQQAFAG
jgi:NADH-quinone oxidoreductase subunit N